MFENVDMKRVLSGKRSEDEDEGLGKPTPIDDPPEELVVAAGEIMSAMGQDYGMSPDASESRKSEFWDKARRLAARLQDFIEIAHGGGGGEEGVPEEE
jgi:hypothetical protein